MVRLIDSRGARHCQARSGDHRPDLRYAIAPGFAKRNAAISSSRSESFRMFATKQVHRTELRVTAVSAIYSFRR